VLKSWSGNKAKGADHESGTEIARVETEKGIETRHRVCHRQGADRSSSSSNVELLVVGWEEAGVETTDVGIDKSFFPFIKTCLIDSL
jgi:hypothetical protein